MKIRYVLIFVVLVVIGIIIHEETHIRIFKNYHCENISISLERGGIIAQAVCPGHEVHLANSINEILGYLLIPFLSLISTLLIKISYNEKRN